MLLINSWAPPPPAERCPDCNALYALVGRRHNCRVIVGATDYAVTKNRAHALASLEKVVTKSPVTKKGRPKKAMTAAQRMRKMRAKRALKKFASDVPPGVPF